MNNCGQLADWMEQGKNIEGVYEDPSSYIALAVNGTFACALGLGVIGKFGDPAVASKMLEEARKRPRVNDKIQAMAIILDIPFPLAIHISNLHLENIHNVGQIISQLRNGGLAVQI